MAMTPQELQSLGERVAKVLGWTEWGSLTARQVWRSDDTVVHDNPSNPAECFKLMAEFNVWPVSFSGDDGTGACPMSEDHNMSHIIVMHDDTPSGKFNAAIEAVLRAVLAIKEQS